VSWVFHDWNGSVADFHAADLLEKPERSAWILNVAHDTVVLGSHQPDSDLNQGLAAQLGIDVTRRNSGGGAVWLPAGDVVWIDLVIPAGDSLWTEDVRVAPLWVGELWRDAITAVDPSLTNLEVVEGALRTDALGQKICFVSEGPGEVMCNGGKVVGISQRRNRNGARFQCCAYTALRLDGFAAVMGASGADHERLIASHVPVQTERDALLASMRALLQRL
jgi:lipoate-protein ligase A